MDSGGYKPLQKQSGPSAHMKAPQGGYMPVPQEEFTQQELNAVGSPKQSSSYGFQIQMDDDDDSLKKSAPSVQFEPESGRRLDFSEKSIRLAFIRKVYGILGVQLLITSAVIALFVCSFHVKNWVQTNHWLLYTSMAITFIVMIVLTVSEELRRKAPHNFILLVVFTLAEGVVVGTFATFFNADAVLIAAGITTVVCIALTMFSFQTKWDVTASGGILFVCLIVLFLFGILTIFFPVMKLLYAAAGALLFSAYLVYDTQIMIGGNHKFAISPEEYLFASLAIYLDVLMIFMYILRMFGNNN